MQLVEEVKPSGLIGASEKAGVFDENVVGALCKATARPLIFALSAEPDGAECSPQDAYHYSNVSFIPLLQLALLYTSA